MAKVSFDDLGNVVKDQAYEVGLSISYDEAHDIGMTLLAQHGEKLQIEHIDDYIAKNLPKSSYVKASIVHDYMKYCAELGLKIDPEPDYPIQLHFSEGKFVACYEPNYESVIDGAESDTPEAALESLVLRLREHIKQ